MSLEESQREEMARLARQILEMEDVAEKLKLPVVHDNMREFQAAAHRLAELAKAVTAKGWQGGRAILKLTCVRCNRIVESGTSHTCR